MYDALKKLDEERVLTVGVPSEFKSTLEKAAKKESLCLREYIGVHFSELLMQEKIEVRSEQVTSNGVTGIEKVHPWPIEPDPIETVIEGRMKAFLKSFKKKKVGKPSGVTEVS